MRKRILSLILVLMMILSIEICKVGALVTYLWPAPGVSYISGYYGEQYGTNTHVGLDIAANGDHGIVAAREGTVIGAASTTCMHSVPDNCNWGMGNYVKIKHSDGTYATYMHLRYGTVTVGLNQYVSQGTKIGMMGSSGDSSGQHLHFQLSNANGTTINVNPDSLTYIYSTDTSSPIGSLDSASGGQGTVTVSGWAFDRDNLNAQLSIHIYIGGMAGNAGADAHDAGIADAYRPDVNNAYPGVGAYHGFNLTVTTTKLGSQPVYVYAINAAGTAGDYKLLGSLTVNINEMPSPGAPSLRLQKTTIKSNEMITLFWDRTDNTACYNLEIYDWNSPANLIMQEVGISVNYTEWSISLPPGNYTAFLVSRNALKATGGNWLPFNVVTANYISNKSINFKGHIYSLYDDVLTWADAKKTCEAMNGHLVTIGSAGEQSAVMDLIKGQSHTAYWLGLTDEITEGIWKTVNSEPVTFSSWQAGQPDNYGGKEDYAGIYKNGLWSDFANYYSDLGFICEIEPVDPPAAIKTFNNNTYLLFENNVQWTEAKAYCEMIGGHLATITTELEQSAIAQLVSQGSKANYWLGASDAGRTANNFAWVTGEPFAYSNWSINQPDNGLNMENYLLIFRTGNQYRTAYGWNDGYNSVTMVASSGFICEIEGSNDNMPITTTITSATINNNAYNLKFVLSNKSEINTFDCSIFIVYLDQNDLVLFIQKKNISVSNASGSTVELTANHSGKAAKASIFVWNNASQMVPLSSKITTAWN